MALAISSLKLSSVSDLLSFSFDMKAVSTMTPYLISKKYLELTL